MTTRFIFVFTVLLFLCVTASAQQYEITGHVVDADGKNAEGAVVQMLRAGDTALHVDIVDKNGHFTVRLLNAAQYQLLITCLGCAQYQRAIHIKGAEDLGTVKLSRGDSILEEVHIVAKAIAVIQKDDTVEFNSDAYKVNVDADAADLVKKMPSVEISGRAVTAQGEMVTKVLVDGQPFWGNDVYAALKNMPADMIKKVQVYNEKSDQEQFTGFNEGPATKTINIITKPSKQNEVFGNLNVGGGMDRVKNNKYGVGGIINRYKGKKRLAVTLQSNNISEQSFADQNSGSSAGNSGLTNSHNVGINYNDQLGTATTISGNYSFSDAHTSFERQLIKTYTLPSDSGQVYNERSPVQNSYQGHVGNIRVETVVDSMNSLLLQSSLSFNTTEATTFRQGYSEQNREVVNSSVSNSTTNNNGFNAAISLLFRHRFVRQGRTFSALLSTMNGTNKNNTLLYAFNTYHASPALNDSLNQYARYKQQSQKYNINLTYTEPSGLKGLFKASYDLSYSPMSTQKLTQDFSEASQAYTIIDSAYSNTFSSHIAEQKLNTSYQYTMGRNEVSVGVIYKLTGMQARQSLSSAYYIDKYYHNILPVISMRFNLAKTKNLQINYYANTTVPQPYQLQTIINNYDPLHLYAGNPALKQPYTHSFIMRYTSLNAAARRSFSASASATLIHNYIGSNAVIALSDSFIGQHVMLAKNSQLTTPENLDGYYNVSSRASYGMPLSFIKCNLSINASLDVSHTPVIINGQLNYQDGKNGSIGATLSSNISPSLDFICNSTATLISNYNSLTPQYSTYYFKENTRTALNVTLKKGIVINSSFEFQCNAGQYSGSGQNFFLWNVYVGKKVFKNSQGYLRLCMYDILNKNNNIQYIATDTYTENIRSTLAQRYILFVFSYKLNTARAK